MTKHYVYGLHAVMAALNNPHRQVSMLYINQDRTDARLNEILAIAVKQNISIQSLSSVLTVEKLSDVAHQGVIANVTELPAFTERDIQTLLETANKPCLILVLDGVTDPHNLGACMRSADAAGVDFIIIPKDKSAGLSDVVSKVACGAAESVPLVRVTNLVRAINALKDAGVWVYGAAGEATNSIYTLNCTVSVAMVMGAEGDGMRRLTRESCDELFYLPMQGSVSSLNVSVATGISLFEVIRQRVLPMD